MYRILSPLRLPISPPGQKKIIVTLLLNSQYKWRRVPESNRRLRRCRPLHNHFANAPLTTQKKGNEFPFIKNLERETRFELATYTLARYRSTSWAIPANRRQYFSFFYHTVNDDTFLYIIFVTFFLQLLETFLNNKTSIQLSEKRRNKLIFLLFFELV